MKSENEDLKSRVASEEQKEKNTLQYNSERRTLSL